MKVFAKRFSVFALIVTSFALTSAHAETNPDVKFEGFVDGYYAYDFNGPTNFDRAYTTQPARSDEFNVNLAFFGATLNRKKVRGRIALQAGTSVQNNYAGEPTLGAVSGPSLARSIQEAYAGYALTDDLWVDAGIYFSHVGAESFISRDNLTYTRSLVADFSPYYQSGVRLNYKASDSLQFQLHVINGWQNISENNHSKMIGTQVAYSFSSRLSASYSTLIGRENEFRHFHDVVLKYDPSDEWKCLLQVDVGFQNRATDVSRWSGFTLVGKYKLAASDWIVARVESYSDPDQVIVSTAAAGATGAFDVRSVSIGLDHSLDENVTLRSEIRQFWSTNAIYPSRDGLLNRDGVVVTSLAAGF